MKMTAHIRTLSRAAGFGRFSTVATLLNAIDLHAQRRALGKLTDDQLADIGLDRTSAQSEAKRPIWDVPANWRR